MADITQCPECQRKLNVPDGQLGQDVRCPACGAQFTAERYVPPRPEAVAPEPAPEPPRGPDEYADRGDDRRDYDDRPRRRSPYARGYGYGERPHRGQTVQILGILSICFCWLPIPCWIMGGIALGMAATDLAAMERGTMDPSGRGATQMGRTCAIIGLALSGLAFFACCGIGVLGNLANR